MTPWRPILRSKLVAIRSNVTQTHEKKMKERSREINYEIKDDMNALRKEEIGFSTVKTSERQRMRRERQNCCSLNRTNLGIYVFDITNTRIWL